MNIKSVPNCYCFCIQNGTYRNCAGFLLLPGITFIMYTQRRNVESHIIMLYLGELQLKA